MITIITAIAWLGLLPADLAGAENWPCWRGPQGNAVSAETGLPVEWGRTSHVRWNTRIPGEGCSSPIVWEKKVFLTAASDHGARRHVLCLSRDGGEILWKRDFDDDSPELALGITGHAASTPVTDGKLVVAFFGNAGIVCVDTDGEMKWSRKVGEFETELGLASSPLMANGRVYFVCDHDGDRSGSFDSFLLALNLADGKTVWKVDRPKLYRSWSSPLLVPGRDGRSELIVNAQDELRAHDPDSGEILWRLGGMTGWVTPTPVFSDGVIYATSGKNGPVLAVRSGGRGDVSKSRVLWRHENVGPYVCSPVHYRDHLYVLSENGVLTCYRSRDGERIYRKRLGGKFSASLVAGDGKLYAVNEDGTTFVVQAGERFAELARNRLEEYSVASPAISGAALFLRTEHRVYCIEAVKAEQGKK